MKKQMTVTVATMSLIVVLAALGFAGLNTKLTATIPFDFNVAGKTMPAGKYTVVPGPAQNTMVIRNIENGQVATTISHKTDGPSDNKAQLMFHRYGNQSFLASVCDGLSGGSQTLPVSKAERLTASGKDHLAMKSIEPETVSVSATIGQ